jgi:Family of unknown function (DUF6519)
MKADLTRDTYHRLKHFTRVVMQQGRVQLDADCNEQSAILLRYLQALAVDLIGPCGGPEGDYGFGISALGSATVPILNDFAIGAGRYYVDGILCELEQTAIPIVVQSPPIASGSQVQVAGLWVDGMEFAAGQYVELFSAAQPPNPASLLLARITGVDPVKGVLSLDKNVSAFQNTAAMTRIRRIATYLTQPAYPVADSGKLLSSTSYHVYLDVWERLVTYIEEDSIREVALAGADTAARAKVVYQVKTAAFARADAANCLTPDQLNASLQPPNRGLLKAMANQSADATDPCIIPPESRFSGPENQLYRVEIHRNGVAWDGKNDQTKAATFKWSRENGSALYAIVSGGGTTAIGLESLGRDDRFGLSEGDWVEVEDSDYVLQNRAANLLQVQSVDRSRLTVVVAGTPDPNVGAAAARHPLLRRWDHRQGDPAEGGLQLASDGAALVVEAEGDNWLELEDGVRIQFQKPEAGAQANMYRTGDYWLIPARTASGDIEWPAQIVKDSQGNSVKVIAAKPPDGITHHYAPLAMINASNNGTVSVAANGDCRKKFTALAK